MSYTNRSFKVLGFFLALGVACVIQGTMLWGFEGLAAQAAASCALESGKTAISQPVARDPVSTAAKTQTPA